MYFFVSNGLVSPFHYNTQREENLRCEGNNEVLLSLADDPFTETSISSLSTCTTFHKDALLSAGDVVSHNQDVTAIAGEMFAKLYMTEAL